MCLLEYERRATTPNRRRHARSAAGGYHDQVPRLARVARSQSGVSWLLLHPNVAPCTTSHGVTICPNLAPGTSSRGTPPWLSPIARFCANEPLHFRHPRAVDGEARTSRLKTQPRYQHYLPQWYQKRFADTRTEQVAAYNRRMDKVLASTSTRNVGVERDFYTLAYVAKESAYYIEETALPKAEGNGQLLLERIADEGVIHVADVPALRELLSLMHMRTKVYRELCKHAVEHGQRTVAVDSGGLILPEGFPQQVPELPDEQMLRDDEVKLQMGRVPMLLRVLRSSAWLYRLVQFTDDWLITSDDPVLARSAGGGRFGRILHIGLNNTRELWFPIDPRRAIVVAQDVASFASLGTVDQALVRSFNTALADASDTWTIWKPHSQARQLVDLPAPHATTN